MNDDKKNTMLIIPEGADSIAEIAEGQEGQEFVRILHKEDSTLILLALHPDGDDPAEWGDVAAKLMLQAAAMAEHHGIEVQDASGKPRPATHEEIFGRMIEGLMDYVARNSGYHIVTKKNGDPN